MIQDFRRLSLNEADIVPSIPGKIRKADGSYTDVLAELGVTKTAVTPPDSANASVVRVDGAEYNVSAVLAHIKSKTDIADALNVMTTRGDIIYRNATVPARLAKGTENQVLKMGANDPAWVTPGSLPIADTATKYATDTIQGAFDELGPLLDAEKRQYLVLSTKPTAEAEQAEGMVVYAEDTGLLQVCRTPGEQEIDSLEVTAGAVTDSGNITIALNGVDKTVAVVGGTLAVYGATITAGASAAGDITITLDDVDTEVEVAAEDTAAAVAGKITTAYAADADWAVGNVNAVLTFTAKAKEVKAGTFGFEDTDTTGVTCTAGITETTPGVDPDSIADVAEKIRDAEYTGWTTGGTGAVVTFTKDAVGACSAPSFTDTNNTGVDGTFTRTNQGVTDVWEGDGWHNWVPSLSWTTGNPVTPTTKARYMIQNHTLFFNVYITSSDGNGATDLVIPLPFPPKDNDAFVGVNASELVGANFSVMGGYIDDGASNIEFSNFQPATAENGLQIIVSGQYEIA
jgi:hypothetical protein